jgi:uncharacterized membrane protein YdbT with pleckstrin-like domain
MGPAERRRLLLADEEVVLTARQHWIALVVPTLWAIVLTSLFVWVLQVTASWDQAWSTPAVWVAGLVLLIAATRWSFTGIIAWVTTRYLLTTSRVVTRTGWLRIRSESMAVNRVHSVQTDRTIFQRLLGSGTLIVESAAENILHIKNLARVEVFDLALQEQMRHAGAND